MMSYSICQFLCHFLLFEIVIYLRLSATNSAVLHLQDVAFVEFVERKYQIPVFSQNDVPVFDGEFREFLGIQITVILRMRMLADEVSDIDGLLHPVVESEQHTQVTQVFGVYISRYFIYFGA